MKATINVAMKKRSTGEIKTVTVTAQTDNCHADLFGVTTHLASAMHAFRPHGWSIEHVSTLVADVPSGFFSKHQKGG